MKTASQHILTEEGILVSFSIARKLSSEDVEKVKDKIHSGKLTTDQVHDYLIKETKKVIELKKIPGLTDTEKMVDSSSERKRITELTYFASLIAKKINEKNIDKYHMCYTMNTLVNLLGLTEDDFEEFYNKFSNYDDDESDEQGIE